MAREKDNFARWAAWLKSLPVERKNAALVNILSTQFSYSSASDYSFIVDGGNKIVDICDVNSGESIFELWKD